MNVLAVVTLIRQVAGLIPVIIELVKLAEQLFPEEGTGVTKFAWVRETLREIHATTVDVTGDFEELWPTLQKVVEGTVAAFKATGLFSKTPA